MRHKHKTCQWKGQSKISKFESFTKVLRSTITLQISVSMSFCIANGQALPLQFVCHTKLYKNYNFQIMVLHDTWGVWLWQLVNLLILVCSFQWCFLLLCLAKLYSGCSIRDKSLRYPPCLGTKANDVIFHKFCFFLFTLFYGWSRKFQICHVYCWAGFGQFLEEPLAWQGLCKCNYMTMYFINESKVPHAHSFHMGNLTKSLWLEVPLHSSFLYNPLYTFFFI